MLDTSNLPPHLLNALRQQGRTQQSIAAMTPREVIHAYCNWNGLQGWGREIYDLIQLLEAAVQPDFTPKLDGSNARADVSGNIVGRSQVIRLQVETPCYACGILMPEGKNAVYDEGRGARHQTCTAGVPS